MKFGLLVADSPGNVESPSQWLSDCLRIAETAAASGFDSIAVGQHFVAYPTLYFQPIPLLARIAAEVGPATHLITGILLLPILPPVEAAEQLATLDVIAGGRLIVGVGAGYRDEEFRAFGVTMAERTERQIEAVALVRQLWSGDTVNFSGKHYQLSGVRCGTIPLQRPGPPIWIAGSAQGAIRRAAQHADGWYGFTRADLDLLERQVAFYRRELQQCGRAYPQELPMRREVFIADSSDVAWQRAEALMTPHFAGLDQWGVSNDLPGESRRAGTFREYAQGRFIIGDPDQCRSEIERYRQRIGPIHMVTRIRWPGMSVPEVQHALTLFGREVIQGFRAT